MATIKMKNEEIVQRIEWLDTLDKVASQKGKLGYAIAVNKRKMADAVQEYVKIKNDAVTKLREQVGVSDDDDAATKKQKQDEMNKLLSDELKDIAWIDQDVDVFTVSANDLYSGTLNSQQMAGLLWMVSGEDK